MVMLSMMLYCPRGSLQRSKSTNLKKALQMQSTSKKPSKRMLKKMGILLCLQWLQNLPQKVANMPHP